VYFEKKFEDKNVANNVDIVMFKGTIAKGHMQNKQYKTCKQQYATDIQYKVFFGLFFFWGGGGTVFFILFL